MCALAAFDTPRTRPSCSETIPPPKLLSFPHTVWPQVSIRCSPRCTIPRRRLPLRDGNTLLSFFLLLLRVSTFVRFASLPFFPVDFPPPHRRGGNSSLWARPGVTIYALLFMLGSGPSPHWFTVSTRRQPSHMWIRSPENTRSVRQTFSPANITFGLLNFSPLDVSSPRRVVTFRKEMSSRRLSRLPIR